MSQTNVQFAAVDILRDAFGLFLWNPLNSEVISSFFWDGEHHMDTGQTCGATCNMCYQAPAGSVSFHGCSECDGWKSSEWLTFVQLQRFSSGWHIVCSCGSVRLSVCINQPPTRRLCIGNKETNGSLLVLKASKDHSWISINYHPLTPVNGVMANIKVSESAGAHALRCGTFNWYSETWTCRTFEIRQWTVLKLTST